MIRRIVDRDSEWIGIRSGVKLGLEASYNRLVQFSLQFPSIFNLFYSIPFHPRNLQFCTEQGPTWLPYYFYFYHFYFCFLTF